ncbi:sperm-associated antigen 1 isoform X1 [Dunckerocampus dactyliophorus]|uniref:sperm-associated antigen 1 isoform X1 n=1 Tax=Dunckerocampus dactyliophorus TaxID=161453 RepID=UPI0024052EB7|nr:sperm-associated antigen 1 isoform X1 [Dunckerocampus dactyliophorus]
MNAASFLQSNFTSNDPTAKIPVEHLEYDYIGKCKDAKYLEKILRLLRSGKEGIYPHLIEFCESHLEKLDPHSRALRKENPVSTFSSLPPDERSLIEKKLRMWQDECRETEMSLKKHLMFEEDDVAQTIPPVRGSNCSVPLSGNSGQLRSSRCMKPRDYREWDKFDVEKECQKIDGDYIGNDQPAIVTTEHPKAEVDPSLLTTEERLLLAKREKDKGNEAFRVNDYEEAVAYYSRSLSIMPTVAAYNNRAQAEIKLKRWTSAMKDCNSVLELEPCNVKALLRRASVHNEMGNGQLAVEDLTTVLREEPHNVAAAQLLSETPKKMKELRQGMQRKGKQIIIQEVEEDDEPIKLQQTDCPVEPSQLVGGDECSAAPAERGDMGNAQKRPHGKWDGAPHSDSTNSHHGHWRSKGSSSDKFKVPQESKEKVANGTSKKGSAVSGQVNQVSSGKETPVGGNVGEHVNLDVPCGALPISLSRLKNEGNLLFKNGQFGDALEKYSQAIQGCADAGIDSPEDLCILYSNRAACYLKDGNSQDCIQDCTRSLELQPFSLKPLLRRAMAYESLERYRKAYVDYKTVLQIDISVQAAHDSVNRITRLLIEQDGADWRDKLPAIPTVPLSAQQHRREEPSSAEVIQARAERAARDAERKAEVRFACLKEEGNKFVKKGQYQDALGKYSDCLKIKPEECAIYTNRALCFLKLERFMEAKQECDAALKLEPSNKKAFFRRAMANKGLKDYLACSSDLQEVLQQDPNVHEAEKELEEVTILVKQSLAKPRKIIPITEVGSDNEESVVPTSDNSFRDEFSTKLQPTNAYDFGQALNNACSSGNMAACADMLASTAPEKLPQFLSTHLSGQTMSFIMKVLDSHLLEKDPNLVYQHLSHLHTADRFSVALMLMEKDERSHVHQLFEHLSAVESTEFTKNDVQNLANVYI